MSGALWQCSCGEVLPGDVANFLGDHMAKHHSPAEVFIADHVPKFCCDIFAVTGASHRDGCPGIMPSFATVKVSYPVKIGQPVYVTSPEGQPQSRSQSEPPLPPTQESPPALSETQEPKPER